jgi:hypothetical protein
MLCVVYVQRLLEGERNCRSEGVRNKDAKREDLEPIRGSTGELGLYVCEIQCTCIWKGARCTLRVQLSLSLSLSPSYTPSPLPLFLTHIQA